MACTPDSFSNIVIQNAKSSHSFANKSQLASEICAHTNLENVSTIWLPHWFYLTKYIEVTQNSTVRFIG